MNILSYWISSWKRKKEAKKEGMPFRKRMWYNLRAMLSKEQIKGHIFIEIFDENGKYINCPTVGKEVIVNKDDKRYRYRIVGFENEDRNKDWLYSTDYINPIVEYVGKLN